MIQVFTESGSENLRSFKSYIVDFERVYTIWKNSGISVDRINDVLYAFGVIQFESRANNYKKDIRYGYILTESKFSEKYNNLIVSYQLKSLQKWIIEGIWDENEFINEITLIFSPQSAESYEKLLYWDFWDLDDSIVELGLKQSLELCYSGNLSYQAIIYLLQRLYLLEKYNINIPVDIDYAKIHSGLVNREERIKTGEIQEKLDCSFVPESEFKEMNDNIRNLYITVVEMNEKLSAWNYRKCYLEFLNSPKNYNISIFSRKPFVSFDDEMLNAFIEAYGNSDNSFKRQLFRILNGLVFDCKEISVNEDIQKSKINLNKLIVTLDEMIQCENDSFTKYIILCASKDLKEKVRKLDSI